MSTAINIPWTDANLLYTLPSDTVLISINNEYEELHRLNLDRSDTNRILTLQFSDITSREFDEFDGRDFNPISEEQALQILNFININKDKNFIIHCSAGISRSAAVALYLHTIHGHELKSNFWNTSRPNRYVIGQLMVMRKKKTANN